MRRAIADYPLVLFGLLLSAFGIAMVYSAGETDMPTVAHGAWEKQIVWTVLGIFAAFAVSRLSVRIYEWLTTPAYIATVVLAPLLGSLESEAPSVRFDISLPADDTPARMAKGEYDLVLTPEDFIEPGHPAELLFEEAHVVVGCATNPVFAAPMTREAFAAAGHVAVRIDGRNTHIENELDRLGLTRRIEVHAPSFIQAPWLLPGSRRIALMHERLARLMAPLLGLSIAEVPFALPPMREMMQFHATRAQDAGLRWLRERLSALALAA